VRLPLLETVSQSAQPAAHFDTGPRSISAVRVLRISITDRCNFRCVYCMPEDGVAWLPKENILSFEEIAEIVRAAIEVHGIRRFKITGGEPTVRHGLLDLIRLLRRIPGIEDLSLTTNGMLLEHLARPLFEVGLDRITVSIDSLRPERFNRITRTGDLAAVLRGLDRVQDVGFRGTKINCVTMRGTNDDEFADFARLTLERPITVRFIEYMPLGDAAIMGTVPFLRRGPLESGETSEQKVDCTLSPRVAGSELGPAAGCGAQDRGAESLIPESQVRARVEADLGPLVPLDRTTEPGVGPAIVYRLRDGNPAGRIGFISAMSAPFCSTCNRLRLTADGTLRSCLFEGGEVETRSILRSDSNLQVRRAALALAMTDCVRLKPDVHSLHGNRQMSQIGG
jgi:GTP 3',8-cyclase